MKYNKAIIVRFMVHNLTLLDAMLERTNNLNDRLFLQDIDDCFKTINSYSLAELHILKFLLQQLGFTVLVVDELNFTVECVKLKGQMSGKEIGEDSIDFSKVFTITGDYTNFILRSDIGKALIKLGYRNSSANVYNAERYLYMKGCVRKRSHRGCDRYRYVMFNKNFTV